MKKTPTDIQDLKKDKKNIRIIPVVVGVLIVGILCVSGYVIHKNQQQAVLPAFALEDDGIIETDNQEIDKHEENAVADNEIADIADNEVEDTEEDSNAEDLPEQASEEKPTKPVETVTSTPPVEKPTQSTNSAPVEPEQPDNMGMLTELQGGYWYPVEPQPETPQTNNGAEPVTDWDDPINMPPDIDPGAAGGGATRLP